MSQLKEQTDDKYVVAYAKFTLDKETGVDVHGVYFGGLGDTITEAEQIARECVNTTRGGTILPKIQRVSSGSIVDALYDATDKFDVIFAQMNETNEILCQRTRR